MNKRNDSNKAVRLISVGLLLGLLPFLIKEYIRIPDFFRGFLTGLGLGLEIIGLFILSGTKKRCVEENIQQ